MSWFTKLEQTVAGKLKEAFTDAKKLSTEAIDDIAAAEQALSDARHRAARFSKAAHLAALAAATKAQAETAALIEAAKSLNEIAQGLARRYDTPPVPTLFCKLKYSSIENSAKVIQHTLGNRPR